MSKSLEVKYHYAYAITYGKKTSVIEVINAEKGVIRINESMIKVGGSNNIYIKFMPSQITDLFEKTRDYTRLELDTYSGITTCFTSAEYQGYEIKNKQYPSCGYILESPPRMTLLFPKGLATIDNFQKGILKLQISQFDPAGYKMPLFPEAILELVRLAESPAQNTVKITVEEDTHNNKPKETYEHKDEAPSLAESEGSSELPIELLGTNIEELLCIHM